MSHAVDRAAIALADRYRIERALGAGGMATVYLAEDLRHHRKVAVKVLREELTRSVGAARFLREIEIAAHLQHPNILPLFESGEADGLLYFVMPYVAGLTLRQRLAGDTPLSVQESIRILVEIVDALAYAHTSGVVHRDIKPDNVMLSSRHALVTDFGVAKAITTAVRDESAGDDPHTTLTALGVTVGTPTYMAPEQATADPLIDHRADLYAIGVLAYEMFAGRPPFTGPTPQQILAAHVVETPEPLATRRPDVPAAVSDVVMKCLAKRPDDRWQTADELLVRLEALVTPSGDITASDAKSPATKRKLPRAAIIAGAVVGASVIVAAGVAILRPAQPAQPAVPTIGRQAQLTTDPGLEVFPAISPDGKTVAYAAGTSARMRIFLRPVGGGRTVTLSNDSSVVESQPQWSPDGERLLFLSRGGVSVAPSFGGTAREVIRRSPTSTVRSAAWSPDGKEIAAIRGDSLLVYPIGATTQRFLSHAKDWHSCVWSRERNQLACVAGNTPYREPGAFFANRSVSAIVVVDAATGRITPVTDTAFSNQSPQWSADGSQLFFVSDRDGPRDIYATSVASSDAPRAMPRRVTTGLGVHSFTFDSSATRLTYAVYRETANLWSLPIPTNPPVTIERAEPLTTGSQIIEIARARFDSPWVYYDSDLNGNSDIYRIRASGGEPERITREGTHEFAAVESPDGREIAFHSPRTGSRDVYLQAVAGGAVRRLTSTPAEECCPAWSSDGNSLSISEFTDAGGIWIMRRDAAGTWSTPVKRLSRGFVHAWSPDGKWIAVASGRSVHGGYSNERLELISPDSDSSITLYEVADTLTDPTVGDPHWSRDGKGVYFKSNDALGRAAFWYVPVTGGRPRLLVRFDNPLRPSLRFNHTTDGRRFFFTINDRQSDVWVAEIR